MPRGWISVVRASVGLEFVLSDSRVYEFRTSAFFVAVDTRHVSSSGGPDFLDLFGEIESDPFWPYKKGNELPSFA